ncbi:UNVERIFIED_CONTAM: hypothetical protein K2H54_038298 [Gekko kuhli]
MFVSPPDFQYVLTSTQVDLALRHKLACMTLVLLIIIMLREVEAQQWFLRTALNNEWKCIRAHFHCVLPGVACDVVLLYRCWLSVSSCVKEKASKCTDTFLSSVWNCRLPAIKCSSQDLSKHCHI